VFVGPPEGMSDDRGWLLEFKANAPAKNDALHPGIAVLRAVSFSGKWRELENSSGSNPVERHGLVSPDRRRAWSVFLAGITIQCSYRSGTSQKLGRYTLAASIATTLRNHIHRYCLFYLCPRVAES
jgi:hypothetical protein